MIPFVRISIEFGPILFYIYPIYVCHRISISVLAKIMADDEHVDKVKLAALVSQYEYMYNKDHRQKQNKKHHCMQDLAENWNYWYIDIFVMCIRRIVMCVIANRPIVERWGERGHIATPRRSQISGGCQRPYGYGSCREMPAFTAVHGLFMLIFICSSAKSVHKCTRINSCKFIRVCVILLYCLL